MASRYMDSELIKEAWFRKLTPTEKAVFYFLNNHCDHAGLCEVDDETLEYYVGKGVTTDSLKNLPIEITESGKVFIPCFIKNNYKCEVNDLDLTNRVHKSAFNLLKQAKIKPLVSPLEGVKDKDKDQEKDNCIKGESEGKKLPELALMWNDALPDLPKVIGTNKTRDAKIKQRLKEEPDLTRWAVVLAKIKESVFCNGDNDRGWKANFDWLLQPETRLKVLEGMYDNRAPGTSAKAVVNDAWLSEAEIFIKALKTFGQHDTEKLREWLQEPRFSWWVKIGRGRVSELADDKHNGIRKLAKLIYQTAQEET